MRTLSREHGELRELFARVFGRDERSDVPPGNTSYRKMPDATTVGITPG